MGEKKFIYTIEQADYIEKYFREKSDQELAEDLELTANKVRTIRLELGFKKQRQTVNKEIPEGMKWCYYCSTFHKLDEFSNNKSKPDGKQDNCKYATKLIAKQREEKKKNNKSDILKKECKGCNKIKDIKYFIQNVSTKDGYSNLCIDCLNKNEIIRKFKNGDGTNMNDQNNDNIDSNKHGNKIYRDVYGNRMKIDHDKLKNINLDAILEDIKNVDKSIENTDYDTCSMEFQSNVDIFIHNIKKYIDMNSVYKLNEIDEGNKKKFLCSLRQLEKTMKKIKNIIR